jgi:ACS family hexuronate transporter-like MFS transporter
MMDEYLMMRWLVLALLFAATMINYLDRLLFSTLSPVLRDQFHFSPSLYGYLSAAFQASYALGFLLFGRWLDRVGTRKGLLAAATVWSTASILHASVTQASQFMVWRATLGFAEGANFPAAFKALAEWFSPEQRSLATGILNAGVNVASIIGPPLFVTLTAHYGWRTCFIAISSLGFLWALTWMWKYRSPPARQGAATAAAQPRPKASFREILAFPPAWGYTIGKVLVDPTWYFLLFWLPFYFRDVHRLEMSQIGWALPVIYFMSGAGSLIGGWTCGRLLHRGWPLRRTRLLCMVVCAAIMPVAIFAAMRLSVGLSVAVFSLAAAAHQAFSSISFMLPADVFPSSAVATVLGFGGFAGAMSSVLFSAILPGYLVPLVGYPPLLLALSFGYLGAVFVVARLFGNFEPVLGHS